GAGALLLLSAVDALYDGDPRNGATSRINEVFSPDDITGLDVKTTSSGLGTGGMVSKLAAARTATEAGIPDLLAGADDASRAFDAADAGTAVRAAATRVSARRFWLGYAAGVSGKLHLDSGAVDAVVRRRSSLLPAGITGVDGDFEAGDVVNLVDESQRVVARGVVAYDVAELPEMMGRSS